MMDLFNRAWAQPSLFYLQSRSFCLRFIFLSYGGGTVSKDHQIQFPERRTVSEKVENDLPPQPKNTKANFRRKQKRPSQLLHHPLRNPVAPVALQLPGVSHVKLPLKRCRATGGCRSYTCGCDATLCNYGKYHNGTLFASKRTRTLRGPQWLHKQCNRCVCNWKPSPGEFFVYLAFTESNSWRRPNYTKQFLPENSV